MNGSNRKDKKPQKTHSISMLSEKAAKVDSEGGNPARAKAEARALTVRHPRAREQAVSRNAPPELERTQVEEGATIVTQRITLSHSAHTPRSPESNSQAANQAISQEPEAFKSSSLVGKC